jgi:uncharacterized protein with ParB-like and HNH nuclease domain/predicted transport protein
MDAHDVRLTQLIDGQKQFIIPVFQRDYSWGTKHCLQLWQDVVRVGGDHSARAHFVGSVVYIEAEQTSANVTRWLLIDGQQRLTTVTLLLAALRKRILATGDEVYNDDLPTAEAIEDSFLINRHVRGERRFKLHLRRADHETLSALIEGRSLPAPSSERVLENFEFFLEQLEDANLQVYRGLRKLVAVDVHLTRGQDDPQMIFESLNSTGLDLTQADLIRNFVLMRQDEERQTQLYQAYWRPIEIAFGPKYRTEFDKFVRDFLTLKLRPSKQFKSDQIYRQFRIYFQTKSDPTNSESVLGEIRRFGSYYVGFSLGNEENEKLREALQRLRSLVEVASPLILQLYDFYARAKTLSLPQFLKAIDLIESYVFRRGVCDMQTRSLYQIFASLAYRICESEPLTSLETSLHRQNKKRRFPTDAEFREALETRDIYDMRNRHYLLDRLENDSKERIDTSGFTIEHVLPQNDELRQEWKEMLGKDYRAIQETWQHRLGNLTLTGYNSEYSDLPFQKKKALIDKQGRQVGFDFSPLRLNKFIRDQSRWTAQEIEERGRQLAARAVSLWPALVVDDASLRAAELRELQENAAKYTLADLDLDHETGELFDELSAQILALGADILQLPGANTVTYRVFEFFVEIIPRKKGLTLLLNLDFDEADDPSKRASDATERAFIIHATETGGVLFRVSKDDDIAPAMHLIRQAYERVSG